MRNATPLYLCALALATGAACSSGGSSGGGGAGNAGGFGGGGSGGTFSGPMIPCQPGDLDLGSLTGAGVSLVPLDGVVIDQPTVIMGKSAFESQYVNVCVPDDTVSVVLYGDTTQEVLVTSYVAPGLGEIVDTSSLETMLRVETPDLMLPKSPEVLLHPGRHSFKLGAGSPYNPLPYLALRRGPKSGASQYGLNLVLVDTCGIDSNNSQAFADAGSAFDQLYAQVGVVASHVGVGFIHDSSLAVLPQANEKVLTQASVESSPKLPMLPDSMNFYFVRELTSNETAGTLLGHAMGIPGMPSLGAKAGVVISVDAHRKGVDLDFGAMWTTAAHEGGHWHGLRHTSERNGTIHDLVADTPQCAPNRDANKDGLVDMNECYGTGSENLMFWIYDLNNPPSVLTPGQGFVLSSALLMFPQ